MNTVHILLIEDDEVDTEAIVRALRSRSIDNPITVAADGLEALAALRGEDGHERVPRPYLVLLDINLPRMNGIEFLQDLRRDEELARSVVFVVTTSDRAEDKIAAYDNQVAGYIHKSSVGKDYHGLANLIDAYWRVVDLPPESRPGRSQPVRV